jgi:hypothetical protein
VPSTRPRRDIPMRCRYRIPYASRRTEPPHLIFSEPQDYDDFEAFLAQVLERSLSAPARGSSATAGCRMPFTSHSQSALRP